MKNRILLFLFCCGLLTNSRAATYIVQLSGSAFSPSTLTIANGDSVTWTNLDSLTHTATSGTSCTANTNWNTGNLGFHASKTIAFNMLTPGTYPYFCIPHCGFMTATLIITNAPNVAPSVAITNPTNNAVIAANTPFTISATAADSDGTVTNVAFLVGGVIFTNRATTPYSATTNLGAGVYTVSAIASDNGGAKATNSVSITVNAPPTVSLSPSGPFTVNENSLLSFSVNGTDTDALTISSPNLPPGATLTGTGNSRTFSWTPEYGRSYASPYGVSFIANDGINPPVTNSSTISVSAIFTPINVTNVLRGSNQFQFHASGLRVTRTNFVQISSNLPSWVSIQTNVSTNTTFDFIDTNAVATRMYRIQEVR